jgi:hypothetical protein
VDQERDFRFVTEKIYSIPGRGVVVSGRVERGLVSVGDQVGFLGLDGRTVRAQVVAIEVSRRLVEVAQAGNEASLLLQGVKKEQIAAGTIFTSVPEEVSQAPYAVSAPEPVASRTSYSSPAPHSADPIHPSSGLGRMFVYAAIGILILLLLMFFQGKWDPKKWDPRKWDPRKKLAGSEMGIGLAGEFRAGNQAFQEMLQKSSSAFRIPEESYPIAAEVAEIREC